MNKDYLFNRIVGLISGLHGLEAKLSSDKTDDVTALQMNLLMILFFSSYSSMSSLSKCLGINLPNCSREVKKLTNMKLVKKNVSASDKRKTELSLTDIGRKRVESFLNEMKDNFFKEKQNWTDEKIKKCVENIDNIERDIL